MPTTPLDQLGDLLKSSGNTLLDSAKTAVAAPIAAFLNSKLNDITAQARAKIAVSKGVDEGAITDLDVAEYVIAMPTAATNQVLSDQIAYVGKSLRNGIIIGAAMLSLAVFLSRIQHRDRVS